MRHLRKNTQEVDMTHISHTTLGDLISLFYDEFVKLYGDEELASVAAASVINELISESVGGEVLEDAA